MWLYLERIFVCQQVGALCRLEVYVWLFYMYGLFPCVHLLRHTMGELIDLCLPRMACVTQDRSTHSWFLLEILRLHVHGFIQAACASHTMKCSCVAFMMYTILCIFCGFIRGNSPLFLVPGRKCTKTKISERAKFAEIICPPQLFYSDFMIDPYMLQVYINIYINVLIVLSACTKHSTQANIPEHTTKHKQITYKDVSDTRKHSLTATTTHTGYTWWWWW
jgi:hypothetical protein